MRGVSSEERRRCGQNHFLSFQVAGLLCATTVGRPAPNRCDGRACMVLAPGGVESTNKAIACECR